MLALLRKAVEANWHRQVAWLQTLIRFRSLRGHEQPCQHWLAGEFVSRGWAVDRYSLADVAIEQMQSHAPLVGVDPAGSLQVVASILPKAERAAQSSAMGKSLILQGHVDVVPTGPEVMWSDPPFSGNVRNQWIYGRGAQDMKSGISALVFALDAIETAGFGLAAPVYLQTVTEEESTGNGALSTLARGYRADACLIPEPTANTITRAQCGAIWFKLKVNHNPIHVEEMRSGQNAVFASFSLLRALQALTNRLNDGARTHAWFKDTADPIKFNPGIIRGGDWASSTPAWCEIDCRLGVLPGMTVAAVQRAITESVSAAAKADPVLCSTPPQIEWNGFLADGMVLEPGSEAENCLGDAHRAVFGTELTPRLSTAVNDTRYYNLLHQIPALCYGPAGEGLHGVNERANLINLKQTTLVIATFVASWCGATRRPNSM